VKQAFSRAALLAAAIVLGGALGAIWLRSGSAPPAGPPEDVVEGFATALAEHRFDSALPYLSEHMRAQTIGETLSVRINMLEQRTGRLSNVRGVPRWTRDTRGYAAAEADTEKSGPLTLGFGLVREPNGDWRIDELYELGWKPPGLQH
jgi:hypothetical protein